MTNNQLNRQRLEKIKSWRETYGAGSNVMLPAEEAEELARIALAAMDSEPVRNPVLAYADSYRDMAKQGVESVPIWSVITDLERNIAPLYRHAQPAPVVPDAYVRDEHGRMMLNGVCEPKIGFGTGWNACRDAMLAAAPQPQNAPQNIPEIIPDCWCRTCRPVVLNDMRFVVCPDCGNKRCPRANDHRNACTRSNEPGQEGSAYPAAPQEVRGE
ncbi:DUF551 domain-containing protein [Klebsiella pneumoniae]|uniref:hypothetical protein n=1 Tax=Klebsiella pneumoniae TaxID=573 RepID=UPI003700AF84